MLVTLLKTFWIPIAFWVVRNGINYYRQARAAWLSNKANVRPTPPHVARVLNVVFVCAIYLLVISFQTPENIFRLTNARLQTNVDVIFSRLASLRSLTVQDEILKSKLISKESRLIYMAYGPEALAHCTFCDTSQPKTFFLYSLPSQLTLHLLNGAVLGVATSFLAGPEGSRWRGWAATVFGVAAILDLTVFYGYDVTKNTAGARTGDYDFFYWKMSLLRPLGLALVNALFGCVLWLSSTNRFFIQTPTIKDRIEQVSQAVETNNQRMWMIGILRNAAARTPALSEIQESFRVREKLVYESEDVVQATASARARADIRQLEGSSEQTAAELVNALRSDMQQPAAKKSV